MTDSDTHVLVLSRHDGSKYVCLSGAETFNVDLVRREFERREERRHALARMVRRAAMQDRDRDPNTAQALDAETVLPPVPYRYLREVWNKFLIVEVDSVSLVKITYTVSEDGVVSFGPEVPVQQVYREPKINRDREALGIEHMEAPDIEMSASGADRLFLSFVDDADREALVALGSSASLDRSPKKNWVENAGGLPPFVREVAREIEKTGKTLDNAIQIAIGRIKVWAAKGNVKATKALAQWEALKAKNASKKVAASAPAADAALALSADRDEDVALIELHGQKTDPGYDYLHSPNPKVAAAANRIFAAARQRGLSVKQAQASIPAPAAWKSAHERDGGRSKLLSGDAARAAERRGQDTARQTVGGNKTGSTRPWQTGAVANRVSKPGETRRKKKTTVTTLPNPKKMVSRKVALSGQGGAEVFALVQEYVALTAPSSVREIVVGGVYETKRGGLAQMRPTQHGYEVAVYPKGAVIDASGAVTSEPGAPVEVLAVASDLLGRALLKRLANQ